MTQLQQLIVDAARRCVSTPFVHAGRVPGAGLDCGGVVIVAYAAAGIDLEVGVGYPVIDMAEPVLAKLSRNLAPVQLGDDLQPADVLVIAGRPGLPCHLGVLTDEPGGLGFVHAWNAQGFDAVIEQPLSDQHRRLMTHAYRVAA